MRLLPHAAVALGLETECRNDADVSVDAQAGAGGGTDDTASPVDSPDDVQSDDVEVDPRAAADGVAGDDDDDDIDGDAISDDELGELKNDPRIKRILNQRRTALRKAAKAKELRAAARALGVTPENLGELVYRARTFEDQQRDPRRGREGQSRVDREPAADWKPPAFDRKSAPFEPDHEGARWTLDQLEGMHNNHWALFEVMRGMAQELKDIRTASHSSQRQSLNQQWTSAADAAKKKLPPDKHELFVDLMGAAYRDARVLGKKADPAKIADHYLKRLLPPKANVPNASARQRIADNVRRLPSRSAYSGGTPAPVADRKSERIGDIVRRTTGGRVLP